jgi:hypothetical protein
MSDFSTFFPSGGGGSAAIGQFYLPGSLETYPDIHTAEDGSVYLKTGVEIDNSSYPLARPVKPGILTDNSIPCFNTSNAAAGLMNLPGENKFLAIYTNGYTGFNFHYTIIDRANPPTSTFPYTTRNSNDMKSSVDNRFYTPAVRDQATGKRYSFSSITDNSNAWYANYMLNDPKVGEVTGSWPNYTAVGTQVSVNFSTAGILPGGALTQYSALYEGAYRPTVSGATSSQGFITFRKASLQSVSSYMTFSLEDGTCSYVNPSTQLTSGYAYTNITQLDNGDIYLTSRYMVSPYAPALQKINSDTLADTGDKFYIPGAFWTGNTSRATSFRGSAAIQGGSSDTFYSFANKTSSSTVDQINEIGLANVIGTNDVRYAGQQDISGNPITPTDLQRLYCRIA